MGTPSYTQWIRRQAAAPEGYRLTRAFEEPFRPSLTRPIVATECQNDGGGDEIRQLESLLLRASHPVVLS